MRINIKNNLLIWIETKGKITLLLLKVSRQDIRSFDAHLAFDLGVRSNYEVQVFKHTVVFDPVSVFLF